MRDPREGGADPGLRGLEDVVFRSCGGGGAGGGVGRGEGRAEDRVGEADFAALPAHEGDVAVVEVGGAVA